MRCRCDCPRNYLRGSHDYSSFRRWGLRVSVCDTDSGITRQASTKIFEPFFTTKEAKETGLELWATRTILQRHEGTTKFRSICWNGQRMTCFSVFLPTRKSSCDVELAQARTGVIHHDLNRVSIDFLKAETELGNTFADKALGSKHKLTVARNREQAQRAYDEVRRHRTRIELPKKDLELLSVRMSELKAKLDKLRTA